MADETPKIEYITVQAGPKVEKGKVALWDRHPDHPFTKEFPEGGQAFIAQDHSGNGGIPRLVAKTPDVLQALREERLVEVKGSEFKDSPHQPVEANNEDAEVPVGKASSPSQVNDDSTVKNTTQNTSTGGTPTANT